MQMPLEEFTKNAIERTLLWIEFPDLVHQWEFWQLGATRILNLREEEVNLVRTEEVRPIGEGGEWTQKEEVALCQGQNPTSL